jgi:hypothetical protein
MLSLTERISHTEITETTESTYGTAAHSVWQPFAAQSIFCDFRDFCVTKKYLRILSGNPLQRKANFCDFRDFCVR